MNYKYKFTITKDQSWVTPYVPIKLIHLGVNKYEKKLRIKRIYIYVGQRSEKVINALEKVSEQLTVDKTNENILRNEFGDKWKKILGIDLLSPHGGNIFNEDEELIDFGEEPKKEKEEKNRMEKEKKRTILKFVFSYKIYFDDSVDTIKEKIEIETNVSKLYQHIFIQDTSKDKVYPFDYTVKYINRLDSKYNINILDLYKQSKEIIDFPIDTDYYKLYKNNEIQIINHKFSMFYDIVYNNFSNIFDTNMNIINQDNLDPFILYMTDAIDVLTTDVDMAKYDSIRKDNITDYQKLFYGFVIKYWPAISNQNLFHLAMQGIRKYILADIDKSRSAYILESKLKDNIGQVSNIDKTFTVCPSVLMIIISISNSLFKFINKDIIDLRVLYEYLQTSDYLIYIEYGNRIKKNPLYEELITDKDKNTSDIGVEKRGEFKLIRFKLRYTYPVNDEKIDRGITISLNKNGIITVQTTWKQWHHASLDSFAKYVIPMVNEFIDKINKLGNMVLIGGYELMHITDYNINIKYMNTPVYYTLKSNDITELDTIYIDPIKLPALMKLYEPYFLMDDDNFKLNEPQKNIIRSLDVRFYKITGFNELSQKVKNQMSINTKILKKHSIKLKFHQQENYFKITLYGTRDVTVLHYAYNFISRFIYLYKQYNQNKINDPFLKKKLIENEEYYLVKHKKYIKYSIPYSKQKKDDIPSYFNIHEFINNRKKFNKIKLAKDVDPVLFNYDHLPKKDMLKRKKISPFSRLCQASQQPIPMCDDCIKKLNVKVKDESILRYESKTNPGEIINYVCLYKTHKYAGFLAQDYHPQGYCLPCCKKKKFMHKKESTAYKRYIQCMNLKTPTAPDQYKFNKRLIQNQKYIKGYGKIGPGRYSWLPKSLMKLFNESWVSVKIKREQTGGTKIPPKKPIVVRKEPSEKIEFSSLCKYKKIRLLDAKSSECTLLYGIKQSNKSYVTALEAAMKIPYDSLIDHIAKMLRKNNNVFDSLEAGLINNRFETPDKYIKYLKNPANTVDETIFDNVVTLFNPWLPRKLNIVIFSDISQTPMEEKIILTSRLDPSILFTKLNNKKAGTIVLIKKKFNYYPLTKGDKFIFNYESKVVKILQHMINASTKLLAQSDIKYDLKLDQFIYMFENKLEDYKIEAQYVIVNADNINICIGLLISNKSNKFVMPINLSPSNNLPIIRSYIYGDIHIIIDFLSIYFKTVFNVNNLKKLTAIVDNSNPKKPMVIGIVLPSKREIYVKPILITKVSHILKKVVGNIVYIRMNIMDADKMIKHKNVKFDSTIIEHTDIMYNNELHNILTLEVNNKLYNERNFRMRKMIMKHIEKYTPINQYKLITKIVNSIADELDNEDTKRLEQVLNIVYYEYNVNTIYNKLNDKQIAEKNIQKVKDLFKILTFNFDLVTIKKIRKLLDSFNKHEINEKHTKIELSNLFKKIFNDIINITDKKIEYLPETRENKKIINLCSDQYKNSCGKLKVEHRQQCYWNKENKCKILMNRDDYNYHLLRFTNEILYNETKQSDLLDIKLDNIKLTMA